MKLKGLQQNQLLLHAWLNDNIISGDKALNHRLAKYLYVIMKCLELKVDHTLVRGTDFICTIYETLCASMKNCKDISTRRNYAHLLILVTQNIRFIEPNLPLARERKFFRAKG